MDPLKFLTPHSIGHFFTKTPAHWQRQQSTPAWCPHLEHIQVPQGIRKQRLSSTSANPAKIHVPLPTLHERPHGPWETRNGFQLVDMRRPTPKRSEPKGCCCCAIPLRNNIWVHACNDIGWIKFIETFKSFIIKRDKIFIYYLQLIFQADANISSRILQVPFDKSHPSMRLERSKWICLQILQHYCTY